MIAVNASTSNMPRLLMVNVPPANLFPGTGPAGNGMTQVMTDQALWLRYRRERPFAVRVRVALDNDGMARSLDEITRTLNARVTEDNVRSALWPS